MRTPTFPTRFEFTEDMEQLVKLEANPRPKVEPGELPLDELLVLPSLFQPRGESLGFNPWASQRHIEELASVVKDGRQLDPLAVVAFGPSWVLVDGHHRREAYAEAGWTKAIPVRAYDTGENGEQRVTWAVALSASLNAKDKLAMSPRDKVDTAWRLVTLAGRNMSKSQLVEATTVKERTIANMRAARRKLLEAGWTDENLYDLGWGSVRLELARLTGNEPEIDPDLYAKQLRRLMKHLSTAVTGRVSAAMLVEALERIRPGMELELETAIQMARQYRRALEELDI